MNSGFRSECVPTYRLLTQEQIEEIHRASLEILETVGVQVLHAEGAQLLEDAGCRRKEDDVFQLPNWLVEDAIRSAPSRITIYNQTGEEAMRLEGRNNYFGLGTDLVTTYDLERGERRESELGDVVNAARVGDYCSDIDFIASFGLPYDVGTNAMYFQCVKAQLENASKPIFFTAAGAGDLELIIEMGEAVVGGAEALRERPFLIHYSEPTAPLRHSRGALDKLFLCAEKGVPICYTPADMLGGSAPVTLAGGLVQANAEALSGVVLHQLKNRGAPIISGVAIPPLDMQTSICSYGAPGLRVGCSAFADLYHYYGLPMWSTVGSDAHVLDEQAGMEHGVATLMAALDGANLIHDCGYLGQGLLGNPAAIVMSDEIISYVKHILRGFEITRETLAIDVMRDVGPGGDYISTDHTYRHFREEQWQPKLLNRDDPDTWEMKGSRTYGEILEEKAREILETHEPEPLPEEVQARLDEIAERAESALEEMAFEA
jgi:trimethylamine--corrinoid protein Co-methyltransferase